jgi:DNA modification methylase
MAFKIAREVLGKYKMIDIFHGDCFEMISVITSKTIDHIIMDPPYDISLNMDELRRICRGNIITFSAPENEFFVPDERAYWIKTPSTKNYTKHLGRFVEHILIERHGDTFNTNLHWSNYTGVYTDMLLTKQIHPFEKPLSLMERLVLIYSNPGDVILDPFMGSGRTGKACQNTGRNFMGIEKEPIFYSLAKEQLGLN